MVEKRAAKRPPGSDATELTSQRESEHQALLGALAPGTELGQYIIEQVIGGGGCGIVYAARHHALRQRVAIKILRGELIAFPSSVTRFIREAEAVNRIRHPNIVSIHEFAELAPGQPYYVMELLDGTDLRGFLEQQGRFSPEEALELLEPVCEAVAAAHAAGIVHRDIKANNVMVAEKGGRRLIKLLDFGIAKMVDAEPAGQGLTEPGARLGTAHNMAPEQIRGERVDERTDIYALGVLIYQLLTGEYPFHGDHPRHTALLHLQAPAPRPSAIAPVSAELDAVVLRCMEKLPERRFPSVETLLAALRSAVSQAPSTQDESSLALGIFLEVASDSESEVEADDELMDDLIQVLDAVEQALVELEFVFPLRTSNGLLAVKLLASGADRERAREEGRVLRAALIAQLAERPHAHASVRPVLSCALGEVLHRPAEVGVEIVGGPLLDLSTWTQSAG